MATVAPMQEDLPIAQLPSGPGSQFIVAVSRRIRRATERLPGHYTVSKLDALEQFHREMPPWMVAAILLLTPMPCLLVNLLLESLPLTDPAVGFRGSALFQLRHFLTVVVIVIAPIVVKQACVPQYSVRSWQIPLSYAVSLATIAVATNVVIAQVSGCFPVPFSQFGPIIPMAIFGKLVLDRRLRQVPEVQAQVDRTDQRATRDLAPILVYPVFTAVFMTFTPSQQLWLSLLLPGIKLAVRRLLWLVSKDDGDTMSATTCGVGHLYHVLFTAMCLQNAKSLEALSAITIVSSGQMLLNCRDIVRDAGKLSKSKEQLRELGEAEITDMVRAALAFGQDEHVAKALHFKSPSALLSTYSGYQGVKFLTRHRNLMEAFTRLRQPNDQIQRRSSNLKNSSIHPMGSGLLPPRDDLRVATKPPASTTTVTGDCCIQTPLQPFPSADPRTSSTVDSRAASTLRQEGFVHNLTSALHQTEVLLLRSYITICMMMFYAIYLVGVSWLSNRRYFATMTTMMTLEAIGSTTLHLLFLCGLEAVFFSIYLVLIWRRLGVSGIYQLAFVLWSQRVLVQAKAMVLPLIILGFPLAHYGNEVIFHLKSAE